MLKFAYFFPDNECDCADNHLISMPDRGPKCRKRTAGRKPFVSKHVKTCMYFR